LSSNVNISLRTMSVGCPPRSNRAVSSTRGDDVVVAGPASAGARIRRWADCSGSTSKVPRGFELVSHSWGSSANGLVASSAPSVVVPMWPMGDGRRDGIRPACGSTRAASPSLRRAGPPTEFWKGTSPEDRCLRDREGHGPGCGPGEEHVDLEPGQ
jgi:hypothetical protein